MRRFILGALLSACALPASADCTFPVREPVKVAGGTRIMFVNECGQWYQVGYRLEGNTLHFPTGGSHTVAGASAADSEAVLRQAYGLIGDRDALTRTKWAPASPR